VDDAEVEATLRRLVPESEVGDLLDVGTGTGRVIEVFADRYARAVGIDRSHEMLTVARHRLDRRALRAWQVRQGDMAALPVADATYDTVTLHMVLHYADNPRDVLAEAARALRPDGRIVVVDFAPHEVEELRSEHAHRRLGFADEEMARWFEAAGLRIAQTKHLPGQRLTVCLWCAHRPPAGTSGDHEGIQEAENRQRGYAA
jgi:ArsR family transcriptional regulator